MTARGKIVLTIVILAVVGLGAYRWWDKIAPKSRSEVRSLNVDEIRKAVQEARAVPDDIPLLIGTNTASLVERSGIPSVSGVSDYSKNMKDGKMIVEFPMNVWPGWAPIILANAGMEPNDQSIFAQKYGFYVRLSIVDDPVKARDLFASGQSHILWGTLDMMALFAPELVKDSRTVPVICQQIDWSSGGENDRRPTRPDIHGELHNHLVEYSTNLTAPDWAILTTIPGDGLIHSLTNSLPTTPELYLRARLE